MQRHLLSIGFRPFFSVMAIFACVAMGQWIVYFNRGWPVLFVRDNPVLWHSHEMLFGFAGAAIAGFLLTASANWVQRPPIQGKLLIALIAAWLTGRLAMMFSALLPPLLVFILDLSYWLLLLTVLAHVLISARNQRNYKILWVLTVLLLANCLYHAQGLGLTNTGDLAIRLTLIAVIVLISIIGGRIIPAFTGNWLRQQHPDATVDLPMTSDAKDAVAITLTVVFAALWGLFPNHWASAITGVAAGCAHGVRVADWKFHLTTSEPLMLILHIAYGWVALSLVLLGVTIWIDALPQSVGIHALTVGAVSTMILAVSARVSLGHTGRPLTTTRLVSISFVLITFAALVRTFASVSGHYSLALVISSVLWIAAFVLFLVEFLPKYVTPRL